MLALRMLPLADRFCSCGSSHVELNNGTATTTPRYAVCVSIQTNTSGVMARFHRQLSALIVVVKFILHERHRMM